ncbi:pilus assembly protein TadC [Jannaschia sp. EhC01]|uniref:Type II secretion system F family protein n=1 Tax=Gymnodinialimonas phycosphaerae TaxID=2841589 RepID=A0A975TUL3_9RHOB|nr:type II secretion system F family protein [Gymnodinialimonas phycosphaerae]MBY4895034.1 type II secretion system F family protein [Gymnodinialimonas phycosphaerae]OAN84379.1 pilus assembly protein TadC [Jannaschia sp. EhC01]
MEFFKNLFNEANAFLVDQLGELGPLIAVGGLGVLLCLVALPTLMKKQKDPYKKLRDTRTEAKSAKTGGLRLGGKNQKLERFAQYLEPQDEQELSATQLQMIRAGYRAKSSIQMFNFAKLALGLGGLLLGTLYVLISGGGGSAQNSIFIVLIPGVVGYYAPKYWITKRMQTREEQINSGFPDALDLMLVCVEAGQSLDQAIIKVATEIKASYPPLAEEFEIVSYEMKAGKDKTKVLRDMGERVGIQDVNSFITTLIQSATFGTSMAEALRVYSDEMRDKRISRAEEKANKLPTKLTLFTMLFCVPPLLVILIGPSIYAIATDLSR